MTHRDIQTEGTRNFLYKLASGVRKSILTDDEIQAQINIELVKMR